MRYSILTVNISVGKKPFATQRFFFFFVYIRCIPNPPVEGFFYFTITFLICQTQSIYIKTPCLYIYFH